MNARVAGAGQSGKARSLPTEASLSPEFTERISHAKPRRRKGGPDERAEYAPRRLFGARRIRPGIDGSGAEACPTRRGVGNNSSEDETKTEPRVRVDRLWRFVSSSVRSVCSVGNFCSGILGWGFPRLRVGVWFLAAAWGACGLTAVGQTPQVTISFPQDRAICRATVPFFGTATVRGGTDADFKEWRLEFGQGQDPTAWTRIAGGNQPVKTDPWAQRTAVWDIHIGSSGNLGDWQTGLTGYQWGEWRNNLNGIYTVRVVAELKNGTTAEKRLTVLIGEAIVRAKGGTANCVDGLCRYSVPAFAHAGQNALVVAIVRYDPPSGGTGGPFPTAQGGDEAKRVYALVPANLERISPIYRFYPNGYETDPPSQLQIDLSDLSESILGTKKFARVFFYSTSQRKWMPLPTTWIGKTASASVSKLPLGEAFFAVLNATTPPEPPTVAWTASSALVGKWTGTGEAGATLRISDGSKTTEFVVDAEGGFEAPFVLNPTATTYEFVLARPNGDKSAPARIPLTPDLVEPGKGDVLRALGANSLSEDSPVYIECESSLLSRLKSAESVIGVNVLRASLDPIARLELKKLSRWSNKFVGVLRIGSQPGEVPPGQLKDGETLLATLANGSRLSVPYRDHHPPAVTTLQSTTHPALLWSDPGNPDTPQLSPLNAQSGVEISPVGGALKLSGSDKDTPRLVRWPITSYSPSAAPFLAFEYKSPSPRPWQILLRSKGQVYALNVGGLESFFPPVLAVPPLIADGKWHTYEVNLSMATQPPLEQVDEILMGSWVKAEALGMVDPGFKSAKANTLWLRNLWVGKPSRDLSVVMQWTARDPSGIRKSDWWVDDDPTSTVPGKDSLRSEAANYSGTPEQKGVARFTLPKAAGWYFHVVAEDASGNRSRPVCFPLRVDARSATTREALVERLLTPQKGAIVWEQPDGQFQLHLPGYGALLDAKKTVMVLNGQEFPLPSCAWDAPTGFLTINAKSFRGPGNRYAKAGPPLGVEGETMKVRLMLYDIAGRKLPNEPEFELFIRSPFVWNQGEDNAVLSLKRDAPKKTWYATWETPLPPWTEYFPDAVNNTLLLYQQREGTKVGEKIYYTYAASFWKRPVRMRGASSQPLVWMETWDSPQSELLNEREAVARQNPECPGQRTVFWTHRLEGDEPFNRSMVRLVRLTPDGQFTKEVIPLTEVSTVVDRQPPGTKLRIDTWLHPDYAKSFFIQTIDVRGEVVHGRYAKTARRRLSFAYGDYTKWQEVPWKEGKDKGSAVIQQLTLFPDTDWTRASILIQVPSHSTQNPITQVSGEGYW